MFNKIFIENEIENTEIQIISSYPNFTDENFTTQSEKTDCMHSRTLTKNGIYSCPFLSDDYRGRLGVNFLNYSKSITAETDFCATCSNNDNFIFTIS